MSADLASPFATARAFLDEQGRRAYDAVLAAALARKGCVTIPMMPSDDVAAVTGAVRRDNPLLFYLARGHGLVTRPLIGTCELHLSYTADQDQTTRTLAALERAARPALEEARRQPNAVLAALALHDFLIGHVRYDEGDFEAAHAITGPLLAGAGVCEGIAAAFKYLCDQARIPCQCVSGWATDRYPEPVRQTADNAHMWNVLTLPRAKGPARPYHVDVTFDLTLSRAQARRDYFGLSDAEITADHLLRPGMQPSCPASLGFYRRMGQFAGSARALRKMAAEAARAGRTGIVFQLPELTDATAPAAFARTACETAAHEFAQVSGTTVSLRYTSNEARRVCEAHFG